MLECVGASSHACAFVSKKGCERTDSSCEELVSMGGSVPPTARVWSHSGLAKYTAAGSLILAADISKQHKNVGAALPPQSLLLPLCETSLV